jgi:hypothetical protein
MELKLLNTIIQCSNCLACILHNCADQAHDKIQIDTEELKTVDGSLDEDYTNFLYYVGSRWLNLYPAFERLAKCWPMIKSYFLSLGGGDCSHQIWKYLELYKSGEERCSISMLCVTQNALLLFCCNIKEQNSVTAPELLPVLEKLRKN